MGQARILIVDDEEDLRDVLSYQLKSLGAVIDTAENGRAALEMARTNNYSAILSDISMPEMNGLELLAQLRAENFDTPFVILTGFGDKAKAVEALRLGAFDFLEKPWEPEKLRQSLMRALDHGVFLQSVEDDLNKVFAAVDSAEPVAGDDLGDSVKRVQKSLHLMKAFKKQLGKKQI